MAALIGRLGSSCLVTPLDDAIHTCCDEKFKPTCELFVGKDRSMRYRCVPRHTVFGEAGEASIKHSTAEFCLQPPVFNFGCASAERLDANRHKHFGLNFFFFFFLTPVFCDL